MLEMVTKVFSRGMPASCSAASSMRPASPTSGLPAQSSLSPGCSPASDAGATGWTRKRESLGTGRHRHSGRERIFGRNNG
jgi:hypothetical protein